MEGDQHGYVLIIDGNSKEGEPIYKVWDDTKGQGVPITKAWLENIIAMELFVWARRSFSLNPDKIIKGRLTYRKQLEL